MHVDKGKLLTDLWERWHGETYGSVPAAVFEGMYERVKRGEYDLELKGDAAVRPTDPDTSEDAAETVRPKVTQTMRNILTVMNRLPGPVTDEQLHAAYRVGVEQDGWRKASPQSVRSRRATLVDLGAVKMAVDEKGEPLYGETFYGGRCHMWEIDDALAVE